MKFQNFQKGPSIEASFHVEGKFLTSIQLYPSNTNEGLKWKVFSRNKEPIAPHLEAEIHAWLSNYVQKGTTTNLLPLLWPTFTPFTLKVLQHLPSIILGDAVSYKELACEIGEPKAIRAVGSACGKNPFLLVVPCHRVIASDGTMGGFSSPIEVKRRLLAFEKDY